MKKVAISQSNYIPWRGYFDNIAQVDEFVLYDDMQYTRRDWRNRNKIKTPNGLIWLTIPVEVKGKYFQKIKDTKVSDHKWALKHLNAIKLNYSKADNFKEVFPLIENLYQQAAQLEYLSEINYLFLKNICDFLGINTTLRFSSEFDTSEENKTQRLVNICKELGATEYYSGPAAKDYMEENLFSKENIAVKYYDYSGYKEYNQLHGDFEPYVSIIDLLLNEGENARNYMKN
jgi:hypothetical protein